LVARRSRPSDDLTSVNRSGATMNWRSLVLTIGLPAVASAGASAQEIASGKGAGSAGSMTLIATQTANNSPSLQFTNLPSSYYTVFLDCNGLITSSDSVVPTVYVGEGPTPTWETGSHYAGIGEFSYGNLVGCNNNSGGISNIFHCNGTIKASPAVPVSIKGTINNVSSSSLYKMMDLTENGYWPAESGLFSFHVIGFWNADTNPVTGLEVAATEVTGATFVSGQCSLYGLSSK
jgi:hypothetical protein